MTVSTEEIVSAAVAGDEPAFAALTERHRRELHVHCYRMLASFDEACRERCRSMSRHTFVAMRYSQARYSGP